MGVLPLVLHEGTTDAHALFEQAVVAQRAVFYAVETVFSTHGKVGWHEQQSVEVVHILRSGNVVDVVRNVIRPLCFVVSLRVGQNFLLVVGQFCRVFLAHV